MSGGFIVYFAGCASGNCGSYNAWRDLYRAVYNSSYNLVGTVDVKWNPGTYY